MAKKRKGSFALGMVIYAVIFLALTAAGLALLWDVMDSYERSRAKNTMDAYVSQLTAEDMFAGAPETREQLDSHLQDQNAAMEVVKASLGEKLSYARKSSVSTETSQTYVLRSGSRVLGEVVITAGEPDRYGFSQWTVSQEHFNFDHLMCQSQSITVPETYTVYANGVALGDNYISEKGIPLSALEEFYDDYETLPAMVTYTAEHILGELELSVEDTQGQRIENWEETDPNTSLDNTTEEEKAMLEGLMEGFLTSYVRFTGSSNQAAGLNYVKLMKQYLIPDSALASRLYTALDGLAFAQSYNDKLHEVILNRTSRIDDTHYFCDVTYLVDTYGKAGMVQTTNYLKLILVQRDDGLRVEAMTRY